MAGGEAERWWRLRRVSGRAVDIGSVTGKRERKEWNGKAVRLAAQQWGRPGTRQGKRFSCCWFGEPRVGVPREQPRSRWPCLHRERRHESAPVHRVHLCSDETAYLSLLRLPWPSIACFRGKDSTRGNPAPGCHASPSVYFCSSAGSRLAGS